MAICSKCMRETSGGKRYCDSCLLYYRESCARHRKKKREKGECLRCDAPAVNKSFCAEHLVLARQYTVEYRKRKVQAGLCGICWKRPQDPGHPSCEACRKNARERARAKAEARGPSPRVLALRARLARASLDGMLPFEREIVELRRSGLSLRKIGKRYGVTGERIRQIQEEGLSRSEALRDLDWMRESQSAIIDAASELPVGDAERAVGGAA